MPFPIYPRPGLTNSPNAKPSFQNGEQQNSPSSKPPSAFPGRNVLLGSFSISLAFAILLIFIIQFRPFDSDLTTESEKFFSKIRIKLEDGEEFAIFGRKLEMGNGDYFLDIPYALETGRFQQAKLAQLPRNFYAIHHENGCPNGFIRTVPLPDLNWNPPPLQPIATSEQCHTLNIYRCTNSPTQLLPVLVYINEGHWLKRSNANLEPSSTIKQLACNNNDWGNGQTGMLIVSINFRMGPFGHFHLPGWPEERRNFALWDIRTALEWIQQNIVHFGGHKAHVTVMARGYGAHLVGFLGILPQGKGLFKRQILLSGSPFSPALLQPFPQPEAGLDASMHFSIAANCANEREWKMIAENGSIEIASKMEQCLAGMGTEAIVAAESLVRVPAFIRWPLVASPLNDAFFTNFSLPKSQFSREIPQIPSIIGICDRKIKVENVDQKSGLKMRREEPAQEQQRFRRRLTEALKEELAERLGQMGDLRRMANDFGGKLIEHYLDAIENGDDGEMGNEPEILMEKIRVDFLEKGPALLETFLRAHQANARAYGLTFECPNGLNISLVDSAERGARKTNEWANGQLACLDDLLFNPMPRGYHKIAKFVGLFAQRVASFVAYGDPNPENDEGRNVLLNWPTAFPRELESIKLADKDNENRPKWMRINEENGEMLDLRGDSMVMGNNEGLHFWMCKLPTQMGIPMEICSNSKMER